uniref:Uncharacterized protein n=1 Tax=Triatoma infestans TaxID=30076 RepID=A0A170XUS3_TRIIF
MEMIINSNEFQNGTGKFIAQTRPVDKEGNTEGPIYPVRTTIIDTDYSNYAVEHKCVPLSEDGLCVYLILSRKPYVLDTNVEPILNKLELKLQDFILMNKPGCAEA